MRRLPSVLGYSVRQVPLCSADVSERPRGGLPDAHAPADTAPPATALAPTSEDHVSNRDLPGPYWQDKPEPYDGGGAYRNGGGEYRDGGYRDGGEYGNGSDADGLPRDARDRSGDGPAGGWTRARRGRRGLHGRQAAGEGPARRVSRAGYVSSDYGSEANGGDAPGYRARNGSGRNGYGRNGRGGDGQAAGGDTRYGNGTPGLGDAGYRNGAQGLGYSEYGNGAPGLGDAGYYGNGMPELGDAAYGRGDAGRSAYGPALGGYDEGYPGGRTGYLGDTQLADDGLSPLPGDEGWGPDGPDGPDGPVGPRQRRLRTPGGPKQRGSWWRHWTLKKAGF